MNTNRETSAVDRATGPCVLFALRRESLFFRRFCSPLQPLASAPCNASIGRGLLLIETGVGRAAVDAVLDWVLEGSRRPALVLYAGFAGALDSTLEIGDVLVADEIVDTADGRWQATWPGALSALRRGRLLTTSQLVATPEEKRRLGALHQALAVDMEAAHAAARCVAHRVPFACVRAISDRADAALSPALVSMLSRGRVAPLRVVAALIRRPLLIGELWRLGRDTRLAARRLSEALHLLLWPHGLLGK
jgi:adenosylhomocysteine nucleosidase